jgi:hypothetical protein
MGIGAKKILDNRQVVMTLDHDVQNKSEKVQYRSMGANPRTLKSTATLNDSQRNKALIFTQPDEVSATKFSSRRDMRSRTPSL